MDRHISHFLPSACSNNRTKASESPRKEFAHPQLLQLPPEVTPPTWGHLILRAGGAYIHESRRTGANKEAVFWGFFFFFLFWLCWIFRVARGLPLVAESRAPLESQCVGCSLRWLLSLHSPGSGHTGFSSYSVQAQQLWCSGLVAPWHVASSWTRDRARVPRIGRWGLIHCTTWEVPEKQSLVGTGAPPPPSRKYPLIPSSEGAGKTPISQVLPGRGLTTCFPSCCLQIQLLISRSATGLSAILRFGTVTGLGTHSAAGSH